MILISSESVTDDEHSTYPLIVNGPVRLRGVFEIMDFDSFRWVFDVSVSCGIEIGGSSKVSSMARGLTADDPDSERVAVGVYGGGAWSSVDCDSWDDGRGSRGCLKSDFISWGMSTMIAISSRWFCKSGSVSGSVKRNSFILGELNFLG